MANLIFLDGGLYTPVQEERVFKVGEYLRLPDGKMFLVESLDCPDQKFTPVNPDVPLPEGIVMVCLELQPRVN